MKLAGPLGHSPLFAMMGDYGPLGSENSWKMMRMIVSLSFYCIRYHDTPLGVREKQKEERNRYVEIKEQKMFENSLVNFY